MLIVGLAMGVTMVLLPAGLAIGRVGVASVVRGRDREEPGSRRGV
jgi:hypothetical protein